MKEEYARQIVDWKYEGEYAEYNLPSYEECIEKKYSIVRTDRKDNYIVYLMDTEVVFYSNIKAMEYNKLYFGVGLKPEYCGKGYSKIFLYMFFLYDFITYSILFVTFSALFIYVSFIVMAHLFGLFPYYWEQISCYLLIMRYVMLLM